jgi:hypothetical protein
MKHLPRPQAAVSVKVFLLATVRTVVVAPDIRVVLIPPAKGSWGIVKHFECAGCFLLRCVWLCCVVLCRYYNT